MHANVAVALYSTSPLKKSILDLLNPNLENTTLIFKILRISPIQHGFFCIVFLHGYEEDLVKFAKPEITKVSHLSLTMPLITIN